MLSRGSSIFPPKRQPTPHISRKLNRMKKNRSAAKAKSKRLSWPKPRSIDMNEQSAQSTFFPETIENQYRIPSSDRVVKEIAIIEGQPTDFETKWNEVLKMTSSLIKFTGGYNPKAISIVGNQLLKNPAFMRNLFRIICSCKTVSRDLAKKLLASEFKVCSDKEKKVTQVKIQTQGSMHSPRFSQLKRDATDKNRKPKASLKPTRSSQESTNFNIFSRKKSEGFQFLSVVSLPLHLKELFGKIPIKEYGKRKEIKEIETIQEWKWTKLSLVEHKNKLVVAMEITISEKEWKEAEPKKSLNEQIEKVRGKYGNNSLLGVIPDDF